MLFIPHATRPFLRSKITLDKFNIDSFPIFYGGFCGGLNEMRVFCRISHFIATTKDSIYVLNTFYLFSTTLTK